MTFLILTIDSTCFKIKAETKQNALEKLSNQFECDDWQDFINEINMIEWVEGDTRFVQNYVTKTIHEYSIQTPSRLETYLKIKPSKKPVKELEEEFDEL